jgi:hypothetical protein
VSAGQVLGSLVGFGLLYLALGVVWVFILDRKIRHGPDEIREEPGAGPEGALGAAGLRAAHTGRLTGDDGARG